MSNYRCADMYRRGTMRDYEANAPISNMHLVSKAPFVLCRAQTVPPLSEYEAWLAANPIRKKGHSTITAMKLRRAVIMRRGGQTIGDIRAAVGTSIGHWLAKLPPELRP